MSDTPMGSSTPVHISRGRHLLVCVKRALAVLKYGTFVLLRQYFKYASLYSFYTVCSMVSNRFQYILKYSSKMTFRETNNMESIGHTFMR